MNGKLILILLLLCILSIINGLFEEQAGEYDWLKENIGIISDSINLNENTYVITDKGVIACLKDDSGSIVWRTVLPEGSKLEHLSYSNNFLYTLSRYNSIRTVKILSQKDGYLLWEGVISTKSNSHDKVDMVVNQGSGVLQVLSDNTITFISTTGKTPEITWKYINSGENSDGTGDIIKSQLKSDYYPVLVELLVPTAGTNTNSYVNVALGCFVKGSTSNCDKAFILSADIYNKKASFSSLMLGFQQVNLDSVHAVVATNAKTFSSDDVIFGKSSESQVTVLPLSTAKAISLDLPLSSPTLPEDNQYISDYKERQFKAPNKFILTTSDGDLLPFVTHCSTDSKVKCDAFAIIMSPKPSVLNAAQCIGRTSALIGFERHLMYPHVAKSITCTAVDSTSTSSSVVISNINLENSVEPTITSSKLLLPNIAISSIKYVATSNGKNERLTLIVEKSGQTFMCSQDKILWTRDEALANVRQVLLINGHNSVIDEENPSEILDFWARLQLQKVELFEAILDRIESIKELPLQMLEQVVPNYEKLLQFNFEPVKKTHNEIKAQKQINREKKRELQRKGHGYTSKAIHFGFDKVALCLSSNTILEGSNFLDASIRISAVDLIKGEVIWSIEPSQLPSHETISMARLLKIGKSKNSLLLSTESGNVYVFEIETQIHDGSLPGHKVISLTSNQSIKYPLVSIFALDDDSSHYLLLQRPNATPNFALVTVYPALKEESTVVIGKFLHYFDKVTGIFQTFSVNSKVDDSTYSCKPLASLAFAPDVEEVLSVSYPSFADSIDKRFTVLGDDSILLKYLNPHIALIMTETKVRTDDNNQTSSLCATVVDTISAKVLYRIVHESGSAPVHAVIVENSIVYTYWNSFAKRTELSSIALYEGMIERFGLNPIAYLKATGAIQQLQKDAKISAFSTPSPIGVQKTYILPKSVSTIQHTVTSSGIANKNILVAFSNGQIYSFDMRMIHPRRPFGDPTIAEKEEGLMQYNPFIHLAPVWAITLDYSMQGDIHTIACTSSRLESSSLVLSVSSLDIHYSRTMPSQGFDILASDFNYPLLILIFVTLGFAVFLLKNMSDKKSLSSQWI